MCIQDLKFRNNCLAVRKWQRQTAQSLPLELNEGTIKIAQHHQRLHRFEVLRLKLRFKIIMQVEFNSNAISEQEATENCCFQKR